MSTYCSLFTRDGFSLAVFCEKKLSTVIIYRNRNRFAFDDDGWRFQLTCGISTSRVGILRKRNSLIGLNVFIQLEGRPRFAHRDRDRDRDGLEHAGSGGERRQVVARLAYVYVLRSSYVISSGPATETVSLRAPLPSVTGRAPHPTSGCCCGCCCYSCCHTQSPLLPTAIHRWWS